MAKKINAFVMQNYADCPVLLKDFLSYLASIKGLSKQTVEAYHVDLRFFCRYMLLKRGAVAETTEFDTIDITAIDAVFVNNITKSDIYEFLHFTSKNGNNAKTRARKLSALKSFYKYLNSNSAVTENPVKNIETPLIGKTIPKYLTLDESLELLNNINSDFPVRDYCILTLFLNCGMRLSELVGIDLSDFKGDTLIITGKGNKQRVVYLNNACVDAIENYVAQRKEIVGIKDNALFISTRLRKRLSGRRVQQIVEECLRAAGLADKGYSPHKLRHTAATLMYRHGNVDMLALKEILGHAHVSTTEIYTHISSEQLQKAADSSPLSNVKIKKYNNVPKKAALIETADSRLESDDEPPEAEDSMLETADLK